MERTVPRTDSNKIGLYIKTYYSLLRSSSDVAIETLVESHINTDSLLHVHAEDEQIDVSALTYASLRLPACILSADYVLLGQRTSVFTRYGFPVEEWQEVSARARRRRAYWDGDRKLALYIASRSDIDDIMPTLTAYQIEWNKIHDHLNRSEAYEIVMHDDASFTQAEREVIADALYISVEDLAQLLTVWGDDAVPTLQAMARKRKKLSLRLLAGSLADYSKGMLRWWNHISDTCDHIDFYERRIYFVSSNMHSLANMWTGYALRHEDDLLAFIEEEGHDDLAVEYEDAKQQEANGSYENFLYYVFKKYLEANGYPAQMDEDEHKVGQINIPSEHGFDIDAQVFDLNKVNPEWLDPRVRVKGVENLYKSDALLINIDYPLGMAAYDVLSRVYENARWVEGVYIMGKSATLNGRIGDVMIPIVVHDEHSDNTYLFQNCFSAKDVSPYLTYGNVLDHQKAVTVPGTFLQNDKYMSVFYREGYTDIEMEAGPYLSAVYELIRPKRHPQDEIVSLYGTPLDIGMIHYASDTPMTKGENLGAGSLSYQGMDPTYASAAAILRRIIQYEVMHVKGERGLHEGVVTHP